MAKLLGDSDAEGLMKEPTAEEVRVLSVVKTDCSENEDDIKEYELDTPDGVFVKSGELVASDPLDNSTDDKERVTSVEVTEGLSRLAELKLKKTL